MKFLKIGKLVIDIKLSDYLMSISRLRQGCLPNPIRHHRVCSAVYFVRRGERASEDAIIIVRHRCTGGENQRRRKYYAPQQNSCGRPVLSNKKPTPQNHSYRKTKEDAFVRAAGS